MSDPGSPRLFPTIKIIPPLLSATFAALTAHAALTTYVLVGHSFAGIVISPAAEEVPDKIAALVYVAAYLPRDGESLQSLSSTDAGSQLPTFLRLNAEKTAASVAAEGVVSVFCADAPPDIQTAANRSQTCIPCSPG